MNPAIPRRHILKTSPILLLSGCISPTKSENSSPTENNSPTSTPTPECNPVELPNPTPTEEGLEPEPYPPYPDNLTKESGTGFAKRFERAYRHNEFLAEWFIKGTDSVLVDVGVPYFENSDQGMIIGVGGVVRTGDTRTPEEETPRPGTKTRTAVPAADIPFSAWYLLTERAAHRRGLEEELPDNPTPPSDLSNSPIVKCD